MSSSSSTPSTTVVSLIQSAAPLLSGWSIYDCQSPLDETCEGGMASVRALQQVYTLPQEPVFFLPWMDQSSPFVNLHPLQWVVNRIVLYHLLGATVFSSTPALLLQNRIDSQVSQRDISELQTKQFPLLLSNVQITPSNSWHEYVELVHFDRATQTANINIVDSNVPLTVPALDSVRGALNYIAKINRENGCLEEDDEEEEEDSTSTTVVDATTPSFDEYWQTFTSNLTVSLNSTAAVLPPSSSATTATTNSTTSGICWISVVYFSDIEENFQTFLEDISAPTTSSSSSTSTFSNTRNNNSTHHVGVVRHLPDLIISMDYSYQLFTEPQLLKESGIWVSQCGVHSTAYCQHRLTLRGGGGGGGGGGNNNDDDDDTGNSSPRKMILETVELIQLDLVSNVTAEMKSTETWQQDITALRQLANDALAHNPIIGDTGYIPPIRINTANDGSYQACQGGECAVGNLFTDALRWRASSHVAFTTSGGYRGPGKPAGPIQYQDLFAALPFPNTMCTGTMTGLSLYKLLDYTTRVVTFETHDTDDGGRLLQVSGMQVTYNTQLPSSNSRLVKVEIWDDTTLSYQPLERFQLYKFATDSFVCGAFDPFNTLTGSALTLEGEEPGVIGPLLHQGIVAEYLTQLGTSYNTSIQGRLVNDTSALVPLDFIESADSCERNTVWNPEALACVPCPAYEYVFFSDEKLEVQGDHRGNMQQQEQQAAQGRILLANREAFSVTVSPKSKPKWLQYTSALIGETPVALFRGENNTADTPNSVQLESGESLILEFDLDPFALSSGTDRIALATVSFGVQGGGTSGTYLGCQGQDITFDIELRVTPADQLNQLGSIRYAGMALTGLCFVTAMFFMAWVYRNRESRVVKVMQPFFLFQICAGVILLSAAIIPFSLDDEVLQDTSGLEVACRSVPWLLSLGFTIAFSALFSKLWRINKLFTGGNALRRITVKPKHVLAPFAVLFTLNVILLTIWSIVDPLRWTREPLNVGEDWNTYGACVSEGRTSTVMLALLCVTNLAALILACHQAYQARNISDEFSESKYIGIAIYGWFQIMVVAVPVMFLLGRDNPTAFYFLTVAVIFLVSMSVLVIVLTPAYFNLVNFNRSSSRRRLEGASPRSTKMGRNVVGRATGVSHISGLDSPQVSSIASAREHVVLNFGSLPPPRVHPTYEPTSLKPLSSKIIEIGSSSDDSCSAHSRMTSSELHRVDWDVPGQEGTATTTSCTTEPNQSTFTEEDGRKDEESGDNEVDDERNTT
jgi:hypothetical protein